MFYASSVPTFHNFCAHFADLINDVRVNETVSGRKIKQRQSVIAVAKIRVRHVCF